MSNIPDQPINPDDYRVTQAARDEERRRLEEENADYDMEWRRELWEADE